jgi:hypothetical protein
MSRIHAAPAQTAPYDYGRIQRIALIVGVLGVAGMVVGAVLNLEQFFQSYLWAYIFWLGLALGSLALTMVQHLVGGRWGATIRRFLESGASTVPLMALLFLPILLLGIPYLYEWSHPEVVQNDPILIQKTLYLNVPFFIGRSVFYFVVWILLALTLNRWSTLQDRTGDPAIVGRFRRLSAGGLVLYMLTMTFAGFDWAMSLEPHWYSTIYSAIMIMGQGLSTFALVSIMLSLSANRAPVAGTVKVTQFHDLGNFMLGFTMLWTYMSLSQFLIIYSGNLPEEVTWYLNRTGGFWWPVTQLVIAINFILPFFLLLQRPLKRNPRTLAAIAVFIFVARIIHDFWFIVPAWHHGEFAISWMDFVAPLAIGGIWMAAFLWMLGRRPLLPLHDHRLVEEAGHH